MSLSHFHPQPKPAPRVKVPRKGITAKLRAKKAAVTVLAERAIKSLVKDMDGRMCRWPDCQVPPDGFWGRLEAAHYRAEGMGGDPSLERCTVNNLIACCLWHHQGPRGLHSGLAKMEPLTDQGTRGPVAFHQLEKGEAGRWYQVGITEPQQREVA